LGIIKPPDVNQTHLTSFSDNKRIFQGMVCLRHFRQPLRQLDYLIPPFLLNFFKSFLNTVYHFKPVASVRFGFP
jgi:hypothetical protein